MGAFPGTILDARLREKSLGGLFGKSGGADLGAVLDAGCGNRILAYQAHPRGCTVLTLSIEEGEIERNRRLFHDFLRFPENWLQFRAFTLYDLDEIKRLSTRSNCQVSCMAPSCGNLVFAYSVDELQVPVEVGEAFVTL